MNFEQIKSILTTGGYYVWTLTLVSGRSRTQVGRFNKSTADDEKTGDEGKAKGPTPKLLKESLETLETHVKTWDQSNPGATFEIVYQGSVTAHGAGILGPATFTYVDQPAPVDPPAPQPLGYLPQQQPPAFSEQLTGLVQLMGLVNQNQPQSAGQMQLLYQSRIEALDAKERDLEKEKRQWRDDMREKEAQWRHDRDEELARHKARLEELNEIKLQAKLDKAAELEAKWKEKLDEVKEKEKQVESKANEFGKKFEKALEKGYDLWAGDDDDEGPAQAAAQLAGPTDAMGKMTEALAQQVYSTGDLKKVTLLGKMLQILEKDPGVLSEIDTVLKRRNEAAKQQPPAGPEGGDDDPDDDEE